MDDIEKLAIRCKSCLNLNQITLGSEYAYPCLPLCVIDAVYSIGVRYEGVKNVIARYAQFKGLADKETGELLSHAGFHTISEFVQSMEEIGIEEYARTVFRNLQRTSTKNGILKSAAVYQFARVLKEHGIELVQDASNVYQHEGFANSIRFIKGQTSGISLVYFYMLTGSEKHIKPDRMVFRFLKETLGRPIAIGEPERLISLACDTLKNQFSQLTPRSLDHEIWKYQRSVGLPE